MVQACTKLKSATKGKTDKALMKASKTKAAGAALAWTPAPSKNDFLRSASIKQDIKPLACICTLVSRNLVISV
jgi:hypothetical protein